MIRLIHGRVALAAPRDATCLQDRLDWVAHAQAMVADSLEQRRAGPRFDFYLDLPRAGRPRRC